MDLILLPTSRRGGVGRAVVADLGRRAPADRGWSGVTVYPDLHNESGILSWQAVGFETERAVVDEADLSPYLLMVLKG